MTSTDIGSQVQTGCLRTQVSTLKICQRIISVRSASAGRYRLSQRISAPAVIGSNRSTGSRCLLA